ncbi:MBL fold metallo-hydrolase [Roseitalea porphyridii]|uniref:MBL fold metallo-hydrolase n=1 Tax=Roseitalea porphyridii TaxID=1852022 RepID=A0A4P6UYC6_9HYPH|nr:MBL fold metallo-hydrolase [Roseitalea porphyridii]
MFSQGRVEDNGLSPRPDATYTDWPNRQQDSPARASQANIVTPTPSFSLAFDPRHGEPVAVADGVLRVTADNPSAFTFHGTNSYIVGSQTLAVIDPGPESEQHLAALVSTIGGRPVSHIFVTHTHADHSPLARRLRDETGAQIVGAAAHHPARELHIGEVNPLDAAADRAHEPDRVLGHGDIVDGDGWQIETIATPGHTANHLAFALSDTGLVFTGDHVMGWATSIVAPPDGAMTDYMASLDTMAARAGTDRRYLPGHGGTVDNPIAFVRGLKTHRKMRERAILERVRAGDAAIPAMVASIYRDTDPRLHGAAGLSVLAHLEDMVARGLVETDGPPAINGRFRPA